MCQEKQGTREFCPGREDGEMRDQMKGCTERGKKGTWAPGDAGTSTKLGCWREALQGDAPS